VLTQFGLTTDSVKKIDDYTVRINIPGYRNTILTGLGAGYSMIISPTAVEKNGLDWARWHPVGTGPFKFVEYERDARLVYEKNEDYWNKGLPYLDGVEFIVIADETVRKIAFQLGDIHSLRASGLTAQELRGMGYEHVTRSGGTFLLIPDSKNAESPFADKRVRLAVSHAINREALAHALGYGFSRPAYQVYPGFIETAIPDLEKHQFDQDLARQLLTEAGYPDGFKTTIHAFIRVVPRDFVTAIQGMLAEVGIEVDADFPEAGRYSEYRFGGWSDAMMAHAMASMENINSGFSFYFGGMQFPSVQKPEGWQEAFDAALSSINVDPVKTQKLAKLMHDEVMIIPYLEALFEKVQIALRSRDIIAPMMVVKSDGSLTSLSEAVERPIETLLSGPAGGPKAGIFYGDIHNLQDIITIDMGGTSFDACLVRNREPEITVENEVAMYRMASPSIAIHTIGSGGGSIAHLDAGGILRVGPQSAGAAPGPACYGAGGTEPTVTDADLTLGFLNPEYFLGGKIMIHPEKARESIKESIAKPLGMDVNQAAWGIFTLVNNNMAQGVKVASVDRGYDPRSCLLVTAGGAGPVHACEIAKILEMPLILVPKASSVFCAAGMLISDLRHDFVNVCHMILTKEHIDVDLINSRYKEMQQKAFTVLEREGIPVNRMKFTYSCDLRYEAQFNEIEVLTPLSKGGSFTMRELPMLKEAFDSKHDILYGYSLPEAELELICLRLVAEGVVDKPVLAEAPFVGTDATVALKGRRQVYFNGETMSVPIYDGSKMGNGNTLSGPAVIEEPTTTIFVSPSHELICDRFSNYLLYLRDITLEESLSRLRHR